MVSRFGDACNLLTTSVQDVALKIDVLRRHCDDENRDFSQIRITVTATEPRPQPADRDDFVRRMAQYAQLGVHTVIVTPTTGAPAAWIDAFAPTVPRLAELN